MTLGCFFYACLLFCEQLVQHRAGILKIALLQSRFRLFVKLVFFTLGNQARFQLVVLSCPLFSLGLLLCESTFCFLKLIVQSSQSSWIDANTGDSHGAGNVRNGWAAPSRGALTNNNCGLLS